MGRAFERHPATESPLPTARLGLSCFGAFQVVLDGAPVEGFRSNKVRALLAYLAVEAGQPHRRERLAGLLWPESPETAARQSLRKALADLRRALGTTDTTAPFLLVTRDAVQFNGESNYWLDVSTFTALLDACEQHHHHLLVSCRSCLQRLQQAVELYQGDFLQQFFLGDSAAFEEWASLKRVQLQRQALEAMGWVAEHYEQCGAYEQACQYLWRQVHVAPWHEEAHYHLMRLYSLSGQRSAALAQYERCRLALFEELGAEPAAETTVLYEQVRAGAIGGSETISPLHRHPAALRHHLPTLPNRFIGHEAALERLGELIEDPACRLVTLVGPGGIGKTRLALQAAAEQLYSFADGVYFVPLAPLSDPELVGSTITQVLGIHEAGNQPFVERLKKYLRGRHMLLVLDNFEHVATAAPLLSELLAAAPHLELLVTSREMLHLSGEHLFVVPPLASPNPEQLPPLESLPGYEAVRLYLERAKAVNPAFSLTNENALAVARICAYLEGLPLAIELAAAWARSLTCQEIATQIQRNLDLLVTSWRDVPERHRSVRAAFDHSWDRLSHEEREVFAKLSVFRGGFKHAAAEELTGASLTLLTALGNKSLLYRSPTGRYGIHELLRQYAHEKLLESREAEETRDRHLNYFLSFAEAAIPGLISWAQAAPIVVDQSFAEAAVPELIGSQQGVWVERLEAEHDNLRAALAWSLGTESVVRGSLSVAEDGEQWATPSSMRQAEGYKPRTTDHGQWTEIGLRLAGALSQFWQLRGYLSEGLAWLEGALARGSGAGAPVRAAALSAAGFLAAHLHELEKAREFCEEALAVYNELRDTRQSAWQIALLAFVAEARGEHQEARRLAEESLTLSRAVGDQWGTAAALFILGDIVYTQGDAARARACYEESLTLSREVGNYWAVARRLARLGQIALAQGDTGPAHEFLKEGLILSRQVGDTWGIAMALAGVAGVVGTRGEPERAARLLGATEALLDTFGTPLWFVDRAEYARTIARVRSMLDETLFAAAWAEGRRMGLKQAIVYGLES